ncbi:MAG: hypothetical protein ABI678_06920, partial [Kofleriaceae bacterium]
MICREPLEHSAGPTPIRTTLADWQQRWMWLAITACGAPGWTRHPAAGPPVSVFDAPPLAGARYLAQVEHGDFGHPGPQLGLERGSRKCGPMLERRDGDRADGNAAASCDQETAQQLAAASGFLFLAD